MARKRANPKKIILIVVIVLVAFCVMNIVAAHIIVSLNFPRGEYEAYTTYYRYEDFKDDYPRTPLKFKSGNNELQAYIYGEENDKGLIVLSHGMSTGHENYMKEITLFVDNGWEVFAFDNTGCCESEGKGSRGLQQSAVDLDNALTYIESDPRFTGMKRCLFGHSWGGYAVTAVLNFDHEVAASASVSGYNDPIEFMVDNAKSVVGDVSMALYPFMYIDEWMTFGKYVRYLAVDGINKSNIPVMLIHGKEDRRITYDEIAIVAQKDKITNPNVEYFIEEGKHGGHVAILRSEDAWDYVEDINETYNKLKEEYDGKIPEEKLEELFGNVDKERANALNEDMMASVLEFFDKAVA